jgi:hypothetical protein
MAQAGLQYIFLRGSVSARGLARNEPLGFLGRNAKVKNQILPWEAVDFVFEVLDPFEKLGALRGRDTRGLMRQIGSDVAVDEDNLTAVQRGFQLKSGFETVAGI